METLGGTATGEEWTAKAGDEFLQLGSGQLIGEAMLQVERGLLQLGKNCYR